MGLVAAAGQVGRAVGGGGDELVPHHLADVVLAHAEADRLGAAVPLDVQDDLERRRPRPTGDRRPGRGRPIRGRGAYRAIRIEAPPSRSSSSSLDLAPQLGPGTGSAASRAKSSAFPWTAQCGTTIAASLVLEAM